MPDTKRVYLFQEGNAKMRDLLGGKGANLAEMTNIGLPVPPGFTVTTEVCNEYYANNRTSPDALWAEVDWALAAIEKQMDKKLGDPNDPLLVSVRSGAKFSMPGMMDTILNLGLNDETIQGLISKTNNPRFAYDAYRRLLMMYSDVVMDVPKEKFEHQFTELKQRLGVKEDTEVQADDLKALCDRYKTFTLEQAGRPFPQSVKDQLKGAIEAVFRSWNNDRAIVYRNKEKISDSIGTAVNIQSMVFGNMGNDCGTGVAFTRNPSTGEALVFGEYLMNAQGEDVVAGIRTPEPIAHLNSENPAIFQQFSDVCKKLEDHYHEMQDIEFTIEKGKLYILQCRTGKRTGPAAVKIAVDMVGEMRITKQEALMRVTPEALDQCLHPVIKPGVAYKPIAKGLPAGPGAATGTVVFDSETAHRLGKGGEGKSVILVRAETNPSDLKGMLAAQGVLTATGGMTSHAALVARGFGIPTVAGCSQINVNEEAKRFEVDGLFVHEGDHITLNGTMGEVVLGTLEVVTPEMTGEFGTFLGWADDQRRLKVRTNADTPDDAELAVKFGAEGIGLCRTEHMFFAEERRPIVQAMILSESDEERQKYLDQLLPFQIDDFEGIFKAMDGKPVTIRLIDPPLHEFLPSLLELTEQVATLKVIKPGSSELAEKEKMLAKVESMHEINPMLGLRGCRLSIVFPQIVKMQTRAILEGAARAQKAGAEVHPEIMIPLVAHVNELKTVRDDLEATAKETLAALGTDIDYMFGTMIEIPRAALTSDEIAEHAEFFSFGTNDLTQTTFGFSRDDAEDKFLKIYVEQKILPSNPFEALDQTGVGKLMRLCVDQAREVRPNIKLGICGEHGGEPSSIDFCHRLGLDYVSCSPFRVPIARLAAAQANIQSGAERDK
jgi:pyruvate,orthophosphate dikinase